MKIGKPTQSPEKHSNSRYLTIYEAVDRLKDGLALPVTASNADEATRIFAATRQHGYTVQRRGLTLFIKRKG